METILKFLGVILMYVIYPMVGLALVGFYGIVIKWGHDKSIDKGYGASIGILLTACLCLVGYAIVCALPVKPKTNRLGLKKYWKCRKCGSYNEEEVKVCPTCGFTLPPPKKEEVKEKVEAVEDEHRYTENWICVSCGTENKPRAKNCINCFEERSKSIKK